MMNDAAFVLGALAVLATPGPTNTLLATSGATRGFRPSLGLLWGELLGYLIAILVLIGVIGPLISAMPAFAVALRILVALYVLYLASVLWRQSGLGIAGAQPVTIPRVFVTTLFNPKAVIFAFTLLPAHAAGLVELSLRLGVLSLLIVVVGSSWIGAGAFFKRGIAPETGYRVGAIALVLFASVIGANAMGIAGG